MIKNLSKHGNSLALVIDRPILELLDIQAETPLEIKTDGEALIISPVRDPERKIRFGDALSGVNEAYSDTLDKLAK